MKIEYFPIGYVRSPFSEHSGVPIQSMGGMDIEGTVEVLDEYVEGLSDLDGFSHIILITHLHLSEGYRLKVVPFLDDVERGVFSTRAPRRPNPIGLHLVELRAVEGSLLRIKGIDMIDRTPVLDIKPYTDLSDSLTNARKGWLEKKEIGFKSKRSDERFNLSSDR